MEDSSNAIIVMILDEERACGNHLRMVAASIANAVNCLRVIGLLLSSKYQPSLAMEDGVAAKCLATGGLEFDFPTLTSSCTVFIAHISLWK